MVGQPKDPYQINQHVLQSAVFALLGPEAVAWLFHIADGIAVGLDEKDERFVDRGMFMCVDDTRKLVQEAQNTNRSEEENHEWI